MNRRMAFVGTPVRVWVGTALCGALLLGGLTTFAPEAQAISWGKKNEKADGKETAAATSGEEKTPEKAGTQAKAKVEAAANDPVSFYNRGVELFQIGQLQAEKGNLNGQKDLLNQAIVNFEKALQKDPKMVEAQSNIGFAYLTMKNYRKAQKEFEKALQIDKNHLNSLNGLANTLTLMNDTNRAIAEFNRLTTLDPGNAQFHFNKGSVLQKMGRYADAKAAYEAALKIDEKDQRTLFNLATLYDNEGQTQQAIDYYQKAKHIDISNPIGLEAIKRLEILEASAKPTAAK